MATYSTDLTTLTTAESGTWVELTGQIEAGTVLSAAGTPAADGENFIQGTDCRSQTTGKANGFEISMAFDYGSNLSVTAGDVIFAWLFYAVGVNLETYANNGWNFVICDSLTTGDYFTIGGSNYGRNPYGGWMNVAVDPSAASTGVFQGGANSGNYRYFGHALNTINEITKGTPSAIDAIRVGRGEISITGSGGSFSELAEYNDYNAGSTPPGTSSTSVDSGRHRLGLFQAAAGTYLWKGLLSLGVTATSVTFSDANATIIIDDCPYSYASFNKIEVNNASSSVTLSNISIISTATTSNGVGYFEMVANATVSKTGCLFVDMGTFIYQSNGTIVGSSYVGCGQITHGGADFSFCNFQGYEGTAGTAYMTYAVAADPDGELDGCSFTKGTAATHAIEFDATNTPTSITLRDIAFSGYNANNGNNDSALYFPSTTKSYTVNLVGCTGDISYRVGSGGSVTLVQDPVSLSFVVRDGVDQSFVVGARVLAWVTSGVNFPYQATVTITGTGTTATVSHTAHGLATNDHVVIEGASPDDYNGAFQITVTGANAYTYTTAETISSSPATGTVTSTFALISGVTDSNGAISGSWEITSDQPFGFRVRQGTTAPYYIGASGLNTLETTGDKDIAVQLTRDL